MSSALVILAPGFEEIEAVTIIDLLRRANVSVTVAGTQRGWVEGSHEITVKTDVFFEEVQADDFDLLVLPGGQPGSDNLKKETRLLDWIRRRYESGKRIAAICAAPGVFHKAGITQNLKITSYPSEEYLFAKSNYVTDYVVNDKNVITSRGVGTAIEFALSLISELEGAETSREVRKKILY